MLPGYIYRTNFSCKEFLIDIDCRLVIQAKPVCHFDRVVYEFVLDTEFLSSKEVSYDEIEMIHRIMQILKDNEKFVLSRFKKYTVEEYKEEERIRKEQSDRMFESLKQMIMVGRP